MRYGKDMGGRRRKCASRVRRSAIEALEPRLHLTISDVQVNSESNDTSSLFWQAETSLVNYVPPGANTPDIIVSYNDASSNATGPHFGNFAYSGNGGSSFTEPATHLATPTTGSQTGDGGNLAIAHDDATGKIFMVSLADNLASQRVIQLLSSSNNGQSFSYVGTVTPQHDSTSFSTLGIGPFDRPWIAIDNWPGAGAKRYIASYVDVRSNGKIYVTRTDDPTSWPKAKDNMGVETDGDPGTELADAAALSTGGKTVDLINHPEVVIAPNHWVYVVWVEMDEDSSKASDDAVSIQVAYSKDFETATTPTWHVLNTQAIGLSTPSADRAHDFRLRGISRATTSPSIAVNPVNSDLYIAYADGDAEDITGGSGETGSGLDIYFAQYAISGSGPSASLGVVSTATPISKTSGGDLPNNDQWEPTIAVAPTGNEIFSGFYDRRNNSSSLDTPYQIFGGLADVNLSNGAVSWSSHANFQITATGTSFYPPSVGGQAANGFTGDYDSASADYTNFYYTFAETQSQTVGGNTVYNSVVHLATIPIQYPSTAPTVPTNFDAWYGANAAITIGTTQVHAADPITLHWLGTYSTGSIAHLQYVKGTDTQWIDYATTADAHSTHEMDFAPSGADLQNDSFYFRLRISDSSNATSSDWAYAKVNRTGNGAPSAGVNAINVYNEYLNLKWDGSPYDQADTIHLEYTTQERHYWSQNSYSTFTLWHDLDLNTTTAADGDGVISFFVPDNTTQLRVEVQYADGSYSQRSLPFSAGPEIISIQNDNNDTGEFELTWDGSPYSSDAIIYMEAKLTSDWNWDNNEATTWANSGWGAICGLDCNSGYDFRLGIEVNGQIIWSAV